MTDMVRLAAVLGDPIAHSKSPKLHGFWLKKYQIAGHYVPLHTRAEDLKAVLHLLPKLGFVGANVTIPHKAAVLECADIVTDRARAIGAANTLTFSKSGEITADNTDGIGFLTNIQQNIPDFQSSVGPSVILGAGGAAKAVIAALLDDGAPLIHVLNRNVARADHLRAHFGPRLRTAGLDALPDLLPDCHLLVNTTSLGMTGQPALNVDLRNLNPNAVVNDIVYAPLKTALLQQAEDLGFRAVDGLGMLLHQAAPGFARWFGTTPEIDDELRQAVLEK
ncbi:shikimate dehydrogenase [Rhodobacteraceae bacterium XHP0102]|nr:shikimate dehydrogenase [Rhodobacteraceae bacterium XHP0102]